ncbi:3-deoxy-D-manno-octulosonic-acid transferase [Marinobacter persicus]|uniref:3-deoxy-D-manno-octulosonic acid transferase n=1 Tax=Marinobacter persicus TaxID=930118 RepID=A0A1I3X829_9GAMM|nr:3-deoxy-D-manno-octulosonic acid transferase [Marinobacter persicus]SFK15724.1 3-deoxy-D-manno-octulosonic-acid transferase [Marinobacter persicus]
MPLVLARFWWQGRHAPALRQNLGQRLGLVQCYSQPVIWVHTASVGEVIAAGPMIRRLLDRKLEARILVTAMTDTGLAQARKMFGDDVDYSYVPLDTPGSVRRFLGRVTPKVAVVLETEIWPNLITQCYRKQVPVFLINARLSERSARGYERVRGLVRPVMQKITWIAAQAEKDAERFRRIGVAPASVEVTGSVKFDVDITEGIRESARQCRQILGARPVWVAGSTHAGEDEQLLEAHRAVLGQHPQALLVIVPRHPDRFGSVAELAVKAGFTVARRSLQQDPAHAQVYLGDTMGELMMLYGAGDMAFVGGSLIERGGHNPLEPAAWGIPVLSGPHVFNFETVYERLRAGEGVVMVQSGDELGQAVVRLMATREERQALGERALAVVNKNRGALDRVVEGIVERL